MSEQYIEDRLDDVEVAVNGWIKASVNRMTKRIEALERGPERQDDPTPAKVPVMPSREELETWVHEARNRWLTIKGEREAYGNINRYVAGAVIDRLRLYCFEKAWFCVLPSRGDLRALLKANAERGHFATDGMIDEVFKLFRSHGWAKKLTVEEIMATYRQAQDDWIKNPVSKPLEVNIATAIHKAVYPGEEGRSG